MEKSDTLGEVARALVLIVVGFLAPLLPFAVLVLPIVAVALLPRALLLPLVLVLLAAWLGWMLLELRRRP